MAAPPPPFSPQQSVMSVSHNAPVKQPSFRRKAKEAFRGRPEPTIDTDMLYEHITGEIFRTQSLASVATTASLESLMTSQSSVDGRRLSLAPSMCTSASSFVITPLATPASSRAPSMIQTDASSDLPSPLELSEISSSPAKGSWVPNFGKMAKAVVHHGMSISPFGEKKSKKSIKVEPEEAPVEPSKQEEPQLLDGPQHFDEVAAARRQEWALEQQQRVQECARLCSQWPQSGYNQMKWGPYGSKQYYEPQSYCNPQHVASVMQRQAELERKMCEESALFFSCRSSAVSSSNPTACSSPSSSPRLSADLSAAMSDSLISQDSSRDLSTKSSLSDLRSLSIDPDVRPARAQSVCGFKRPMTSSSSEEDKRRRVDEAMVVEEALETGVISNFRMSASTPNLTLEAPAVFGHVVKTSDTHPIIISPFLPQELINVISRNVVPVQNAPSLLVSMVDVPSLLLSCMPPVASSNGSSVQLGNLLLSSCPGKRLRMEGPVKGRGPVCRDLETDLRRIKNEGVGCLVCCLDDSELALLGVPWETYSSVAASIGLDVVRLPMPDGFTPVSLSLFDAQINLIANKYSLQGINVLVHCRGGVGRAGLTASAWAIKMGFVTPHPSLTIVAEAATSNLPPGDRSTSIQAPGVYLPAELEHQICMSMVERVIAMIRSRRGLKAIESFEQVQFLAAYVKWLRSGGR